MRPPRSPGSASGVFQAAAATWGQQGAQFAFSGGGPSSAGTGACASDTDGANTVGWKAQSSASVLAITCSWNRYGTPFRTATEFDMEIDPDWNWTTGGATQVDLQSVALHEFGHALGLEHSPLLAAVMYATYRNGTEKRTPAQDDIDGLLAIYGPQGGLATSTPTLSPTPTPFSPPTPFSTSTPAATTPSGATAIPASPSATATKSAGAAVPTPFPTQAPLPTSTPTAVPTPAPTTGPVLPIPAGVSLLVWPGEDGPVASALARATQLRVVYAFDPANGSWSRYAPAGPSFLNNLATLRKGAAYWFVAAEAALVPYIP